MIHIGEKKEFPLSSFMKPISSNLSYMPVLAKGQKLIACCGKVYQFLWLCQTDKDVADLNWVWGKRISWYIMPELVRTTTTIIQIVQVGEIQIVQIDRKVQFATVES